MVPEPPPVPFVAPRRFVTSPHELVRQHTPQLEKQSPKKINISKYSRNSNKSEVTKRIFNMRKKMLEEKHENIGLSEKIRQLLSSKKSCKGKASLHQDEETLEHQNVDDYGLLDKNQSFEVDQSIEEEPIENVEPVESITSEKQSISEHQLSSTDTEVLLSNVSNNNFVSNSPNEWKKNNPLSSLPSSAIGRSSPLNVKSYSNDDRRSLLQSEKFGSSYSSESKEADKKVN